MERLKGLDGIRGVLALSVAVGHTLGHLTGWTSGINPIKNASYAVDVFFMMSGIVLYHVYKEDISNKNISITKFLGVRLLRLYPLHLATIIAVPIILKISVGELFPSWLGNTSLGNVFGDLSLLNAMAVGFDLSFNQPSWSISVEFYLGSALLIAFCKTKHLSYAAFAIGLIIAISLKIKPIDIREAHGFLLNGGIIRCLYSMSAGVVFYDLFFIKLRSQKNARIITLTALFGLIVLTCIIALFKINLTTYLIVTPFIALSLVCITMSECRALDFLDTKILMVLGKRSYSIYLLHTPVVYMALAFRSDNQHENILLALLCIALTVFLSKYSEKYIERPFIRYSHAIKGKQILESKTV